MHIQDEGSALAIPTPLSL